jgi:hypothetical protein
MYLLNVRMKREKPLNKRNKKKKKRLRKWIRDKNSGLNINFDSDQENNVRKGGSSLLDIVECTYGIKCGDKNKSLCITNKKKENSEKSSFKDSVLDLTPNTRKVLLLLLLLLVLLLLLFVLEFHYQKKKSDLLLFLFLKQILLFLNLL